MSTVINEDFIPRCRKQCGITELTTLLNMEHGRCRTISDAVSKFNVRYDEYPKIIMFLSQQEDLFLSNILPRLHKNVAFDVVDNIDTEQLMDFTQRLLNQYQFKQNDMIVKYNDLLYYIGMRLFTNKFKGDDVDSDLICEIVYRINAREYDVGGNMLYQNVCNTLNYHRFINRKKLLNEYFS